MNTLLDAIHLHTAYRASGTGLAGTAIPGLSTVRAITPSGLVHAISQPLFYLVVQGAKELTTGARTFSFAAGASLLVTADVPTVSQITRASAAEPYLSLVFELDPAVIADLAVEMRAVRVGDASPVTVEPTDAETADAALRLLRLLDRPAAMPILRASLVREMHYWLMVGRHGHAIRRLGIADGHAARVARAVAVLRVEFDRPVPVERLAGVAGMSAWSFHQHFRAVTSLSPLQFQKQLRLIEARRLMRGKAPAALPSRSAMKASRSSPASMGGCSDCRQPLTRKQHGDG